MGAILDRSFNAERFKINWRETFITCLAGSPVDFTWETVFIKFWASRTLTILNEPSLIAISAWGVVSVLIIFCTSFNRINALTVNDQLTRLALSTDASEIAHDWVFLAFKAFWVDIFAFSTNEMVVVKEGSLRTHTSGVALNKISWALIDTLSCSNV